MDEDYIFYKLVLEHFKIEEILTPKNLGEGEIVNTSISTLRNKLDTCFDEIESYTLKEELIDFIEDHWLNIATDISTKKRKIKSISKNIKSLKRKNPNLDLNISKDENILNIISNQESILGIEKFILMYLKEQQLFMRSWASQKRVEYKELPEKFRAQKRRNKKETKKLIDRINNNYIPINKFPKIFLNAKSYMIFKDYSENIKKYELTEFSFIYRVMFEEGLINNTIGESVYRKWLGEEFDKHFIKIKKLHSIGLTNKVEKFKVLKEKYKPLST
jgi:hypothetical protein